MQYYHVYFLQIYSQDIITLDTLDILKINTQDMMTAGHGVFPASSTKAAASRCPHPTSEDNIRSPMPQASPNVARCTPPFSPPKYVMANRSISLHPRRMTAARAFMPSPAPLQKLNDGDEECSSGKEEIMFFRV